MSKKKESPNKYEKASDNLRELFESRLEAIEKSGEAIKKLSDKVNELSDKADEPIQYYPIESVCKGDGFEQPVFNFKDQKVYVENLRDAIESRRDEISRMPPDFVVDGICRVTPSEQPIFNHKDVCSKKCDTKNCCKDEIKMLRKEISDLRRSYNGYKGAMKQADRERDAKVRGLVSDISVHDNCIMNLHGRLEELEEKEPTSIFRKRYLVWFMVGCIAALSIALISAYFK